MIFISDGTWFDKETEAKLITEIDKSSGLFSGIRNGKEDEEICYFYEFEIREVNK